jgi:hypothetical protein
MARTKTNTGKYEKSEPALILAGKIEEKKCMQELKATICPLANKEHIMHGHGNKCCKMVGCGICENRFCKIGNPSARQLAFYGFIGFSTHNIIVGYAPIYKDGKYGKIIHDPRGEGIVPDGYIEDGEMHNFNYRLIKEFETVEEAETYGKMWSEDRIILFSTSKNDNGLYPVLTLDGLTKEDTDILHKAWTLKQKKSD